MTNNHKKAASSLKHTNRRGRATTITSFGNADINVINIMALSDHQIKIGYKKYNKLEIASEVLEASNNQ